MRAWLIILLFLLPVSATAATYKCVDDQGKTEYSDIPCPGGEEVKLPALSTFDAPAVPQRGPSADEDVEEEITNYSVSITTPEHESSFWSNEGSVNVNIGVEPQLGEGDQLILYVDGAPSLDSPLGGNSTTLTGLERGTHSLRAVVQDASGKQLSSSSVVQIHINQRSVIRPNP